MSVSRALLLCLACFCVAGCISSSRQAKEQNIRTATDAKDVEGMTLVKSWTARGGYGWGPTDMVHKTANHLATQEGYANTVVLIEMVDPGHVIGDQTYGRGAVWKMSIYKQGKD